MIRHSRGIVGSFSSLQSSIFSRLYGNVAHYATSTKKDAKDNKASSTKKKPVKKFDIKEQIRRRKRQERGFEPHKDDIYKPLFPQHLGYDEKLNWSLNKLQIFPYHNAYRNANIKCLVHYSQGRLENSNLVIPLEKENEVYTTHFINSPIYPNNLNDVQFRPLLKDVKEYISNNPHVFVQDGVIGSDRSVEFKIRGIATEGPTGLYLRNMFAHTRPIDPTEFKYEILTYIAPNYKPTPLSMEKSGLKSASFTAIDPDRGILVVAGTQSLDAISTGLVNTAANRFLNSFKTLVLQASTIGGFSGDKKPVLLFMLEDSPLFANMSAKITGAHYLAWGSQGLARVFDGVTTTSQPTSTGNLIHSIKDGAKKYTSKVMTDTPISAQPGSVVFVTQHPDLPAVTKVTAEKAHLPLMARYTGPITLPIKSVITKFKELISSNNVNVYIVNAAKGNTEDILDGIKDGKVDSPSELTPKFEKYLTDIANKAFPGVL
eukprot:TRINITY_DN8776_c0_g3_i1.p1 TRINITY_DN8776_c0_g3~~TRINITY_DN8776_c0_g3_i1.p1  ORF type:complete len:488 (-),score=100.55 TRINITY_DN8776_c0_g3_i1:139-1602(-)